MRLNIRIHKLNNEGIEEYIIVKVFGMFQWRSLEDVGCQISLAYRSRKGTIRLQFTP